MSKGGKKNKKAASSGDDGDDWEALLAAEAASNGASEAKAAEAAKAEEEKIAAEAAAAAALDDDDDGGEGGNTKDKKKKKKKKGGKDKSSETKEAPLSAKGAAILARQQAKKDEEARIKAAQDAEEERIRKEEEEAEAETKRIEEEKEKKRKAKEAKIEAQKAAGTYMTKAQKEKAKKQQARLEAMQAAGMIPIAKEKKDESGDGKVSMASMYSSNKRKPSVPKKVETEVEEVTAPTAPTKEDEKEVNNKETNDEFDDFEDDVDDWENGLDDFELGDKGEEEDAALAAKLKEKERLKELGIEREKRAEQERIRLAEEEAEKAELERREREAAMKKDASRKRRIEREEAAMLARSPDKLRSPISVIMGHVDTGKTKLLDKIRNTSVQEGEAGGITQQIGATQFPKETLALQTQAMQQFKEFNIDIPGLLMIDTPGHESFTNLRNRGSTLCDIAILVIDLMHGLEQQTIESLNMLRRKKAPFVVALNKVDRCYGWKSENDSPIRSALGRQDSSTMSEFNDRASQVIVQLAEQGVNAKLYWENDSPEDTISLVPTSAMTGEGVPDLLHQLILYTQNKIREKLMYVESLQCTVLEVKVIEGLGTTVDVVLVNGTLKEGDTIIISTLDGPVTSTVRALLTPPPNREMRVKSDYVHHQSISGATGVKIVAPDIGKAVAGTPLLALQEDDDEEDVKEDVMSDLTSVFKSLSTDAKGVTVHASTLGALEALLQFLREECKPPIPVSSISIGTIFKKDVMKTGLMHDKGSPEFATILAFDVGIDREAESMAAELNVKVFQADIIYHLFDQFTSYMGGIIADRKAEAEKVAVFPCILKILPQHVFNKKDPIVMGVEVVEGVLRVGTPLTVPANGFTDIGKVIGIENNHKDVNSAKKGLTVAVKVSNESNPNQTYGRQFDHQHPLYSRISRQSINALKEFFKSDVTRQEWELIIKMKKVFNI